MKPHKIIRNMLSKLKFRCRNHDNGCDEVIDYDKLETHEEFECKFEIYDCPEKKSGCTARMNRGDIEKHLRESCLYSHVECMYCNKKYLKKDIRDHLQECD